MTPNLSQDHLNVLYLVHAGADILSGCRGLVDCTQRLNQLSDLHRAGLISEQDPSCAIDPARLAAAIGFRPGLALAA